MTERADIERTSRRGGDALLRAVERLETRYHRLREERDLLPTRISDRETLAVAMRAHRYSIRAVESEIAELNDFIRDHNQRHPHRSVRTCDPHNVERRGLA